MKKLILTIFTFWFAALTANAQDGFGAVKIDKQGFETYTFWCQNKTYYSDVAMTNFHGCDIQPVGIGRGGAMGQLISVYHDWQRLEDGSKAPLRTVFVEMPNENLYRLKTTAFLTSPLLQHYFEKKLGRAQGLSREVSNILLAEYSTRNLQLYGSTFCVEHYLKRPFNGVIGWCQGDTVVGGEVGYVPDALPFTKAAILAQRYIYDMALPVRGRKIFHHDTRLGLNVDAQGRHYWAFGVPAAQPNKLLGMFSVLVYMNGHIERKEYAGQPPAASL